MKSPAFPWLHFRCALALGLPAPFVFFVAADLVDTPGVSSWWPLVPACLAGGLYLAFAQFWVVPRGAHDLRRELPTVIGELLPLAGVIVLIAVLENPRVLWTFAPPVLATGFGAEWLGAACADRTLRSAAQPAAATDRDATSPARRLLCLLAAGCGLLAALIATYVAPTVGAEPSLGFNAHTNARFLQVMACLVLAVGGALLFDAFHLPALVAHVRRYLGPPAVTSALLGFVFAGAAGVCWQYAGLRPTAAALAACAAGSLAVSGFLTWLATRPEFAVPAAT